MLLPPPAEIEPGRALTQLPPLVVLPVPLLVLCAPGLCSHASPPPTHTPAAGTGAPAFLHPTFTPLSLALLPAPPLLELQQLLPVGELA